MFSHYLSSFSPSYHFHILIPHYAIFLSRFHHLLPSISIVSHTLCLLLYKILLCFGINSLPSCLTTSNNLLMHCEAHEDFMDESLLASSHLSRCSSGLWALLYPFTTVISQFIFWSSSSDFSVSLSLSFPSIFLKFIFL